jgi:hypothetical protein
VSHTNRETTPAARWRRCLLLVLDVLNESRIERHAWRRHGHPGEYQGAFGLLADIYDQLGLRGGAVHPHDARLIAVDHLDYNRTQLSECQHRYSALGVLSDAHLLVAVVATDTKRPLTASVHYAVGHPQTARADRLQGRDGVGDRIDCPAAPLRSDWTSQAMVQGIPRRRLDPLPVSIGCGVRFEPLPGTRIYRHSSV